MRIAKRHKSHYFNINALRFLFVFILYIGFLMMAGFMLYSEGNTSKAYDYVDTSEIKAEFKEAPKTYEELQIENNNLEQNIALMDSTIKELEIKINDLENQVKEKNEELNTLKTTNYEVINTSTRGELPSRGYINRNIINEIVYDPHTKTNYSPAQLNMMLVDTGLEGYGEAFYNMEQTYNVNSLFAIGVAMHESANGYKLANTYNYFGFRGNNGWMGFDSPADCINYFGKLISNNYNHLSSIEAIQSKYCPDGTSWASMVKQHMKEKFNKSQ